MNSVSGLKRNNASERSKTMARRIYVALRDFLLLLYQRDAEGNLVNVFPDGLIDVRSSLNVPWSHHVYKDYGWPKRTGDFISEWLRGKSNAPLYLKGNNNWCLNIEDYPDAAQAMEWLRFNQLRPEQYLARFRGTQVKTFERKLSHFQLPLDPIAAGNYLAHRVNREWLDSMIDAFGGQSK